jgi:hypothetical protein
MTINILANAFKAMLNNANASEIASLLAAMKMGNFVRAMPTQLFRQNPDTFPNPSYDLATLDVLPVPDDAHAATIFRAYARATAAAGTLGELAVQAFGATPADAQIAVTPNGNIAVLAASRYTDIDVLYLPRNYDVVELTLPVVAATGVCVLPTASETAPVAAGLAVIKKGYQFLLEAEVLAGGVLGKRIILVPGAVNPATLNCRMDLAATQAQFTIADAVTQARVKIAVAPPLNLDALLTAASTIG